MATDAMRARRPRRSATYMATKGSDAYLFETTIEPWPILPQQWQPWQFSYSFHSSCSLLNGCYAAQEPLVLIMAIQGVEEQEHTVLRIHTLILL